MATKELSVIRNETDVGQAALTMAVAIVVERVSRLSKDDKADLFKLVRSLASVQDQEEFELIREAMLEILEHEEVAALPLGELQRSDKAEKWAQYVGRKVQKHRTAKGMTQSDLAKVTGLPQSHISRIERAEISPSHVTVEKLAKGLGVPVNELDSTR